MSITRRVRSDGSTGYLVRVSIGGRRLPAETFDTHREARRREAELVTSRKCSSTTETCDIFAEHWPQRFPIVKSGPTRGQRKSEGTIRTNTERLKPFVQEFGGIPLAEIERLQAVTFAARHPMSAVVARGMFQDAVDAGLLETNPFSRLNIAEKPGRRDHAPLTVDELEKLADLALGVHGPDYGPAMRSMILFTAYSGARSLEGCALEWDWVDFARSEVAFKVAKFKKPRTVLLLDEAAEALRSMPRHVDEHPQVFRTKRGLPIRGKSGHHYLWRPVQLAFWAGLSQRRQAEVVDLDWHSLRHFCGWYFYVHLGLADELTAYQLGHSDAKLVRDLYGHGQADALERLKRQSRVHVTPIRATPLPHAASETA